MYNYVIQNLYMRLFEITWTKRFLDAIATFQT